MIDPDDDDVRCRWPSQDNECNQANNGVCGLTPKARLKGVTIQFKFTSAQHIVKTLLLKRHLYSSYNPIGLPFAGGCFYNCHTLAENPYLPNEFRPDIH